MRLVAYVRVSTERQGESGLGLEAQRAAIESWCSAMGHSVVGWFEDRASASSVERVALKDAMGVCAEGGARGLVVLKLDRLTRSVRDFADLIEWSEAHGVALLSVRDSLDTSTSSGRMVANIIASVAQWEREAIGERTRAALAAKRMRGEPLGAPPLGLCRDERGLLVPTEFWRPVFSDYLEIVDAGKTVTFSGVYEAGLARPDGRVWSESGWRRFRRAAALLHNV